MGNRPFRRFGNQPQRFNQPPPNRPFNGPRKINALEIQAILWDLPPDERLEFQEAYDKDKTLKPFGDF